MEKVTTLEELYAIIDNPDFHPGHGSDNKIIPLMKAFGVLQHEAQKHELLHVAQLEIDIQNFSIRNNVLSPSIKSTLENGEPFDYPSLKNITEEDYAYIKRRLNETRNRYLQIRYAHLLWLSLHKHISYAHKAIEQYLLSLPDHENASTDGDGILTRTYKEMLLNVFHLSVATKNITAVEELKKKFASILNLTDPDAQAKVLQFRLMHVMLEQPKVFSKEAFTGLDNLCLSLAESYEPFNTKIDMYHLGEKVSRKSGGQINWASLIGDAYEQLSIQREDPTNLVSIDFCQKAIHYFRKAKSKNKVAELERRYKTLKQNSRLAPFLQEIDLTEKNKQAKALVAELAKGPAQDILVYMTYSPFLFPPYQYLYDHATEMYGKSFSHSLMNTANKDEFGHTSGYYSTREEKLHFMVMQHLDIALRTHTFVFLREIFIGAIKDNKLLLSDIYQYLRKKTWFGRTIEVTYKEGSPQQYNWLETIMPAINEFFGQIYFFFQNPVVPLNHVLAVDSLAMKIEGLIRDFCELRGVNTFFQTPDKKGNLIMQEKDLNALLHEEVVQNTFSKDDLMLLQFIFVDKAGWNLRNRVAHSLMKRESNYTLGHILMIIVAILRIGKIEYGPPDTGEDDNIPD